MFAADWRTPSGPGVAIAQHKDHDKKGFDVDSRGGAAAIRVTDRQDGGGEDLGHWKEDPEYRGDINGLQNWPRAAGPANSNDVATVDPRFASGPTSPRPVDGWQYAWPTVMDNFVPSTGGRSPSQTGGDVATGACCPVLHPMNLLPVKDKDMVPARQFGSVVPERPKVNGKFATPKYPKGYYGIGMQAVNTEKQVDYFLPADGRLVAPNASGDPQCGTYVVDLDADSRIDIQKAYDRMARLQSMMRVMVKPSYLGATPEYNVIAWTIGPTGCDDTRGGYVFEKRIGTSDVATPGGGGGGGNDVATPGGGGGGINAADVIRGKIAQLGPQVAAGTIAPDVLENLQLSLNLINGGGLAGALAILAGGGGGGGGGAGGGPPPASTGTVPKANTTCRGGIAALISHFDSGHSDVGSENDKHYIGSDRDGHKINALHVSTNAYFRRDDFYDAPLEFGGPYVDPHRGVYLMPVYLRYDARPAHPFVGGPKPGLWRWEAECCFRVDQPPGPPGPPPPPPDWVATGPFGPPGGGGGGGGGNGGFGLTTVDPRNIPTGVPTIRQWELGMKSQKYAMTQLQTAFPAILGRPNSMTVGAKDLRAYGGILSNVEGKQRSNRVPITARLEAFGSMVNGEWQYTQKPNAGRYTGGTTPGGFALMPPELDMFDYGNSFARSELSLSTVYLGVVPTTAFFAAGVPDPSIGKYKNGYRWGVDSSGNWKLEKLDSTGAATEVFRAYGTEGLLLGTRPTSTDAWTFVGVTAISTTSTQYTGGGGAQTIRSATLPANFFTDTANQTRRGIRIKAWGISAANGNAKALTLTFGATTVALNDISTNPNGDNWQLDAVVFQTATANVQESCGESQVGYQTQTKQRTAPGETTSGTITVAVKATCGANGDVTIKGFLIECIN